jgi:hypothetical protein
MRFFQLLLFLLFSADLMSAVYYVRKDGSDLNTGTANTSAGAWLSLAKANSIAVAGDTINVGPGIWGENINLLRGGTSGNPIIWNGSGVDTTTCDRFNNNSKPYVHIKNMTIAWQIISSGSHNLFEDLKFTFSTPTGGQIEISNAVRLTYTTTNVTIRRCSFNGIGSAASINLHGSDSIIEDCYFTSENGGDAIYLNGYRNILRLNKFEQVNKPLGSTQHTDLIQSWSNNGEISQDHIIERNFAINCDGCAIFNIDNIGDPPRIKNWTWRNNVFIRVSSQGNLYTPGHTFYNNTFFRTAYSQGSAFLVRAALRGVSNDTRIFNNIFYKGGYIQNNVQGFYGFTEENGFILTGFEANNNLVIGEGAGVVKAGDWTRYGSNTNSLNGVEPLFVNSIDPTTPEELRLLPNSPIIAYGANLSGEFTNDYFGNSRSGSWSVGAMQYSSGEVPSDVVPPTVVSAVINSTGLLLTVTYSENVVNVSSVHYTLTGATISSVSGTGPTRVFSLGSPVQAGTSVVLGFTSGAGRTGDSAGNVMATFSDFAVTNNSLDTGSVPPRPGSRNKGTGRRGAFSQ